MLHRTYPLCISTILPSIREAVLYSFFAEQTSFWKGRRRALRVKNPRDRTVTDLVCLVLGALGFITLTETCSCWNRADKTFMPVQYILFSLDSESKRFVRVCALSFLFYLSRSSNCRLNLLCFQTWWTAFLLCASVLFFFFFVLARI